jgi:integral membrane protein (TIGR00529 family)
MLRHFVSFRTHQESPIPNVWGLPFLDKVIGILFHVVVRLFNPLLVFAISIILFLVLLYRKVGLGISLTATAFLMSFLSLGINGTVTVLLETCKDQITLSLVFASFFIILMSILYKETGLVDDLTRSLGGFIKNSKVIVSILPAVIGLMPVAGGALMSAPIVDAEANKLGLDESKKAFINIWFRHAIIPVYPLTQFIILTSALTQTGIDELIIRQVLVVLVMIAVGYYIGLRKTPYQKTDAKRTEVNQKADLKQLLTSFLPIMVTVVLAVANVNIAVSTLAGVITILTITKTKTTVIQKTLKNKAVWEVTLAAFAAMLFKNVTVASGASEIIGTTLANTNMPAILLLSFVPAILGFLMGSPSAAVALSLPILAETVTFIPETTSLLFISAYLGYMIAPTHLCLVFTAQYFKLSINRSFKYLIPATVISMATAIITYLVM